MNDTRYAAGALNTIRKNTLLLTIAKEYLCEDVFLIKLGNNIKQNIQRLKDDISSLKKKFPGKFATEVETDDILEKISATAQALIDADKDIKEGCKSGELGRKLEADVKSIAEAVNLIKIQVQGKKLIYTRKESFFNIFSGLRSIGRSLGSALILGVKILSCLIIIAIVAFSYLYFTMEKEGPILKEIAESREFISDRQKSISQLELRKKEVSEEIELLEKNGITRDEKIAIMDLEMEIQKINQDSNSIEAEINAHEKKISDNQKKIEEIKKTSFIERLLRQ